MADGAFDKDFGYLMPFLDRVAEAASSLSDPAAREELTRLMPGEKEKWARIRQLLNGAAGQSQSSTAATPASSPAANHQATSLQTEPERPSFTVGSLRPRR